MSGVRGGKAQTFTCTHADCRATFPREWKLKEHKTAHTGARPCLCTVAGCGRSFKRKSHLSRHMVLHKGVEQFKCQTSSCVKTFLHADGLKRHELYAHGDENGLKCNQPNCSLTFKKRRLLKLHLQEHGVAAKFKCCKDGCTATFETHIARKAHEKKHAGYRCRHPNCQVLEHTWSQLQKHMVKHTATFTCTACKKVFQKADALRQHKRKHATLKPVLVCPRDDCQAYFSTTFSLEHHIRKVHLQLLKYKCSFPDCPRMFAMRESMNRHLLCHDPSTSTLQKRWKPRKSWQKRLNGNNQPLVEDNLRRLFTLRMWISRRAKVEANLSGLFSERKIPHYVDPEVNLRDLFKIKQTCPVESLEAAPVKG
ncbi:P43 5S RNA-binding protein-like [Nematolebias whitei]|uniref:P43 5S RNA-binding protein-like n=1 Tax=Nematolebias whitei TaxID=451745 RepID=UPI0018977CB1|nr:P43 5S RNA-binding protein-like [Nematolebias whitei]